MEQDGTGVRASASGRICPAMESCTARLGMASTRRSFFPTATVTLASTDDRASTDADSEADSHAEGLATVNAGPSIYRGSPLPGPSAW
jgi:hypothetical protein